MPKHQQLSKTWKSQVTDLAATSILWKHEFYHAIPRSRTYSNSVLLFNPSISISEHSVWSTALHCIQGCLRKSFFYLYFLNFIEHLLNGHAVHRRLRHAPHPIEVLSFLELTKGETIITTHWSKSKLKIYTQNSVKPKRRHHRAANTHITGALRSEYAFTRG